MKLSKFNFVNRVRLTALTGLLAASALIIVGCGSTGGASQDDLDALDASVTRLESSLNELEAIAAQFTPEVIAGLAALTAAAAEPDVDALKIGFLADYSDELAEFGPAHETAVRLAIEHINAAGGVNGKDVTLANPADTALNAAQATTEARRLITVDGVHAIVGPLASSVTTAVAEAVSASEQIPTISPSATSPGITALEDNDFLFRTAISDAAQGVILADNLVEQTAGVESVGVIHLNDAYGQGLAEVFEDNFDGDVALASYEKDATNWSGELRQLAGRDALVVIGFAESANVIRAVLQDDLFDTIFFVDGNRSEMIVNVVGAENLEGRRGTAPDAGPETTSGQAWNASYMERYGSLPSIPFVRESYDAVLAIALAAEAANSVEGADIRDQLRNVTSAGGTEILPNVASIRAGLTAIKAGQSVNYEGGASSVEWDENGDLTSGFVAIWEFQNGVPTTIETFPFTIDN